MGNLLFTTTTSTTTSSPSTTTTTTTTSSVIIHPIKDKNQNHETQTGSTPTHQETSQESTSVITSEAIKTYLKRNTEKQQSKEGHDHHHYGIHTRTSVKDLFGADLHIVILAHSKEEAILKAHQYIETHTKSERHAGYDIFQTALETFPYYCDQSLTAENKIQYNVENAASYLIERLTGQKDNYMITIRELLAI